RGSFANSLMADRLDQLRRIYEPLLRRFFFPPFLLLSGLKLGGRAGGVGGEGPGVLVVPSRVIGWGLSRGGGGRAGAAREEEEGDIDLTGEAVLHGIFLNSHVSRRDHVAVYVVRQFKQDRLPEPNHEIIECGFFAATALPEGTTPGTRLRIAEVLEGRALIKT